MGIDIIFQKIGTVEVGTADPNQKVVMVNPKGKPTAFRIDLVSMSVEMDIKSWDDRNSIYRTYPIQFTPEAWQDFLLQVFEKHIRPIAKESYSEFVDLIENPIK